MPMCPPPNGSKRILCLDYFVKWRIVLVNVDKLCSSKHKPRVQGDIRMYVFKLMFFQNSSLHHVNITFPFTMQSSPTQLPQNTRAGFDLWGRPLLFKLSKTVTFSQDFLLSKVTANILQKASKCSEKFRCLAFRQSSLKPNLGHIKLWVNNSMQHFARQPNTNLVNKGKLLGKTT